MELYDTEEQQVEAIKDWWKENGKAVIIGAVVGLGGLFGWRYYQDTVIQASETASQSYTTAMNTLQEKGVDAQSDVQAFIESNEVKEYSVLAALQLAKAQVEAKDFAAALEQLKWAQSNTKDAALSPLISYRIARIETEMGNFDAANTELGKVTDTAWAGRIAELRGDIALRQGDKDAAYAAYTEAQQAADASPTLQMKLDDLAK
ncbi:YfgM family protein [Vibrio parahaemolyticus]|uniref:Ancillary SecYEG translocon subunit n=13 Tax=Vibrionaceae TaxID=641 RepID=A0A072LFK3_VIBPH|nr:MULTISPECIES: YfgM family protein [Vibrio]EFO36619.1 tetratricopeptide repeat family protein [Vibrio parahaemolyticus Peru-466]EFO44195.1 tetratricopeptide repeat family protein [Vibrio parahaemolyticus AQ4037]EJG0765573.1 YfgM family protein [Vibrio parahaemolyticus O5:K30]EJG0874712.1 YfgM family protein [Vibrio parahaemolyticus O3]EJG0902989.1 YfgM family protein [Vibrio parahaemolyticus O3:K56]EJG0942529.1 YfgM family protein [Vibrio parahaemolyticus O1]EJG0950679.1 YfgM family protei